MISETPAGTRVSIVTYDTTAKVNLVPTRISLRNRPGIHGKIPGRVGKAGPACLSCGLKLAAKLVENGGKIVLVTAGDNDVNSKQVMDIPLYTVTYSGIEDSSLVSNSRAMYVLEDSEDGVDEVANVFSSILRNEELLESRHRFYNHRVLVGPSQRAGGKFVVEESLNGNLHVVASTNLKEDIESFELVSPSGKQFQFPVVEKGILHHHFPGTSEPGVWGYTFKTSTASGPSFSVSVSASADRGSKATADLEVWTEGKGDSESPLKVYARVSYGMIPVSNARVTASIRAPGGEHTALELLDIGGGGYPDLSPGDGIYSAYFTAISPQPGLYSISVQATDGAGLASIREISDNNEQIPTPAFTRYARASFHVAQGIKYFIRDDGRQQIEDVFPPARITDLRVAGYTHGSVSVELAWTAPGGDFNEADTAALRYEIRCYTHRGALSRANFSVTGIPVPESVLPSPLPAGSLQEANITLPWTNEVFFYGIIAIDGAGNRGEVSNLVQAYVDELPKAPEDVSSNSPLKSAPIFQAKDDNIIYIVSGSLTGLALIALSLGVAFICRTKRKDVLDKSDSLDYIKELGPSTLLPASKYAYDSNIVSPNYANVVSTGSYSTGTYSAETETYSAGTYSPEPESSYCKESQRTYETGTYPVRESYSPPRTSPSEYSTDSVFMAPKQAQAQQQQHMYMTYQNLPHHDNSESELSTNSTEQTKPRREWELSRQQQHTEVVSNTWNGKVNSTYGWEERRDWVEGSYSVQGVEVSVDYKEKRMRRESFV